MPQEAGAAARASCAPPQATGTAHDRDRAGAAARASVLHVCLVAACASSIHGGFYVYWICYLVLLIFSDYCCNQIFFFYHKSLNG